MQQEHRDIIQKNFSSLVVRTDLDLMVSALYERGVFSDAMIEPYKDTSKDAHTRKQQLYRDITRRGPEAFNNLLEVLSEHGYWDLVRDLDPTNPLHPRPTLNTSDESNYVSLSKKSSNRKELNDPNRNRPSQPPEPNDEINGNSPHPPVTGEWLDTERPQINVIKSSKFFEDGKDLKLYPTYGKLRGVLVLFSYYSFEHNIESARPGASVDETNLRYLFSELGFKPLVYRNLTLESTRSTLEALRSSACAEGADCVFVVFSSHGYSRGRSGDADIRCSDGGLISIYSIIDYFNNKRFAALEGVPKVFIFQNCRGANDSMVHKPSPLRQPRAVDGGPRPRGLVQRDGRSFRRAESPTDGEADDLGRLYSDILIAQSTVPGFVSNRDPREGSWYIQALCKVFAERAHDCHVEKLFTLVDKELMKQFHTQTSSVDRWGFNRRLYLHPGLQKD